MNRDDEALVRRAIDGESEAFGALIDRHQAAVAGFLLSLLHDPSAAEEIAQAAFVQAYKNLKSFRGQAAFKTWVSRIAINLARSQMRWRKLRAWISLEAFRGQEESSWEERLIPAGNPSGDEREALERRLDLERAMSGLSPREREVTALRLEGYTLSEIAQALVVSEGTVKSTLFGATRKIKERLK